MLTEADGLALELGELLHHVLKRRVMAPPSEINAQIKHALRGRERRIDDLQPESD